MNKLPVYERIYIDKTSEGSEVATRVRSIYPAEIIFSIDESDLAASD